MHVDIFIDQKGGDWSPRTFSEPTPGPLDGPAATPELPTPRVALTPSPISAMPTPLLPTALSRGNPNPSSHPGPFRASFSFLTQCSLGYDPEQGVLRLKQELADAVL